ncbi:MAG TPA: hypothetical protein VKR58_12315 [Aquella sp.]|nr:hypothetical protein [Aquella sp.]
MCGIIGIVSNQNITHTIVNSLKGLQHRGQQAAGIGTMDGNLMHLKNI